MKPLMMSRPLLQKAGSDASRPNGASRSLCLSVPPAPSIARYFDWKSGTLPDWNTAYSEFTRQSPKA